MRIFLSLYFYNFIFMCATPCLHFFLRSRIKRGKEDKHRWREKLGKTNLPSPPNERKGELKGERKAALIWVNAVSVGEALAVIPLIERLLDIYPNARVCLTTSTTSAAQIAKDKLPPRAFHQFTPLDHPLYVRRFLDHWQPALALWVESELWPNLIIQTAKRSIPMALVNARFSDRSAKRWLRVRWLSSFLLSLFDVCLAQDEKVKKTLLDLGARAARVSGNLKYDAKPLPYDEAQEQQWRAALEGHKIFLAASTHAGEEAILIKTHLEICAQGKKIKTIIAPRHPPRAAGITALAPELKMEFYSSGAIMNKATDIYIVDRIGVLGLFYRLADIVFMGGSLIAHGGQNPLEAARMDCALLSGEGFFNFQSLYRFLQKEEGVRVVRENNLTKTLAFLLDNPQEVVASAQRAKKSASSLKGALEKTLIELKPILEKLDVAAT